MTSPPKGMQTIGIVVLIGLAACTSSPTEVAVSFERVSELSTDGFTSIRAQSTQVIRDHETWAGLWESAFKYLESGKPPLRTVDFAARMVLVAAAGAQPSSGYDVAITEVRRSGDVLVADVQVTMPGSSCRVLTQETAPLDAVIVPAFFGEVRFAVTTIVDGC